MRKTTRAAAVFMVISLMLSVLGIQVFAAASPSEAKESVVVIQSNYGSYGSGFAVGKPGAPVEYIVTNDHIVNSNETTATVWFSLASDSKMLASVVYADADKDIAVLRLPEPTTQVQALTLCPMKYVDPDDTFAALGYPSTQLTGWPQYNKDDITMTRGGIKKSDRLNASDVYLLDLAVIRGNSGGPLINSAGEVVGINTYTDSSENYAVVIDELINNIDPERIPVSIHQEFPILYLIIGAVLLLLIILLAVILVLRQRNKPPVPSQIVTPPDSVDSQTGSKINPVESKTVPGNNPAPARGTKAARLIAVGGTLNAKKFSITGTVKMGRDASMCAVAFPVNTQGVSGKHCEISFDGTVCYIKDLNSTYGTFTADGRKLTPNVPQMLKSGDKFYLAGPENTFEVRF